MFKTKDFYLASTLVMLGNTIQQHTKEDLKTVFYFEDSEMLQKQVQDYFYDRLRVSPHQFQTAIKTIKSIIYS